MQSNKYFLILFFLFLNFYSCSFGIIDAAREMTENVFDTVGNIAEESLDYAGEILYDGYDTARSVVEAPKEEPLQPIEYPESPYKVLRPEQEISEPAVTQLHQSENNRQLVTVPEKK